MQDIVDYIKSFLVYGDENAAKQIGYTADETKWHNYKIIIRPSGHLGKDIVYPTMNPIVAKKQGNFFLIEDDIIYTAFFFISRAEELIVKERDEHKRFLAKYSILGKNNRLQIPLLDEYARAIMKLMGLSLPSTGYNQIYLTHDIDTIDHYRHLRGFVGGVMRNKKNAVLNALEDIHHDPAYTFPWLIEQDQTIPNAQVIYFVKHTKGHGYDYPQYRLNGRDWQRLKNLLLRSKAHFGLHSSYYGDIINPRNYILHRSHYLRCSIAQMQRLVEAGIKDDFTMAFPDQVGFRLQTTRAVRWINPQTMTLTPLTLHHLTVMDCTLTNDSYMHLMEDEAYFLCEQLFDRVKEHHGDLCLLWHNDHPAGVFYLTSLYPKLLKLIHKNE